MPYIKQEERPDIDAAAASLIALTKGLSAGQLNYALTSVIKVWIGEPSYSRIATATGVIENVKQELYRRLASPYEDAKIAENGDVY